MYSPTLLVTWLFPALISQTYAFFCSEGKQIVLISVVWDGKRPPELDWKSTPRWEEAVFQPKWPESFAKLRRGKQGKEEMVTHKRNIRLCYKVWWDVVLVDQNKDLSFVFNETVRQKLADSTLIVGHYAKAIANLATENNIPYLITSPQPPQTDPLKASVPKANTMLYMWPSWVDVARTVTAFLQGENCKKVLVLYTGLSTTAFDVSQLVHSSISRLGTIQYAGITVLRYPDIPKLPSFPGPEQVQELDAVYKLINDKRVDTVVAFLDSEDPMWLLQQFFVEGRSLDRADLTWLLIDQTFTYNSKMTQLERVRVLRTPIYTLVPSYNPGFDCMSFYDNTNKMGARDAMLVLDTVLKEQLNPKDFTKQALYEALRDVNIDGPLAYSKAKKIQIEKSPVQLGWNISFDAKTHVRNHYEMQIRHLLPDATVYGRTGSTCGTITSVWFSDRIPVGTGIATNYVRVNEIIGREQATQVVAVEDFPMVGRRYDPSNTLQGNERFEGISVDIFQEAVKVMATRGKTFKYNIYLEPHESYGRKNESTGRWNGLFGQIQQKKARVAIGHIAKTTSRMLDFTFTQSFGFIGLTYLMKRQPLENDWFPFLRPFEPQVWGGLMFTMLMSGIFVHLLEWWNPYRQPTPDPGEPSLLSLKESGWYSYLTMTAIGAPYAPSSHPTRAFSVFYWFFALLVVACYTGNLASFLTESRYRQTPSTLTDLLHQDELTYGTIRESSNADFFMKSPIIDFRKMYKAMVDNDGFVGNYREGIERVKNSSYALIGDNILLNYYAGTDKECELVAQPSGASDLTEVAFVVDTSWPLRADFSAAIAELREDGTLREIYNRWLSNAKKCKAEAKEDDNDTAHLTFRSFHGLYLLLGLSGIVSLLALYLKMARLKRRSKKEQAMSREGTDNVVAMDVIGNKFTADDVNENDVTEEKADVSTEYVNNEYSGVKCTRL